MDPRLKDWANEVLSFYENEGVEISGTNEVGVFKFISEDNAPIPFLMRLSENGLTISFQARYPNITYQEINAINAQLAITKIYAPNDDDLITFQTAIPILMEADVALDLVIHIFIQESKLAMDRLEDFSNKV